VLYVLPLAGAALAAAVYADLPLVPAAVRRFIDGPPGVPAE
jgi:hypothetical protein